MTDQLGHGISVHIIGLLIHRTKNKLSLIAMTDKHKKGSIHLIESIDRLINKIDKREGEIPPHLFLQLVK